MIPALKRESILLVVSSVSSSSLRLVEKLTRLLPTTRIRSDREHVHTDVSRWSREKWRSQWGGDTRPQSTSPLHQDKGGFEKNDGNESARTADLVYDWSWRERKTKSDQCRLPPGTIQYRFPLLFSFFHPALLIFSHATSHVSSALMSTVVEVTTICPVAGSATSSRKSFTTTPMGSSFLSSSHRLLIVVLLLRRLIVETSHCRAMTRWQDGQCVKHRMTNKTFPDTECSRKWNILTTSHRRLIVETSHRRDVSSFVKTSHRRAMTGWPMCQAPNDQQKPFPDTFWTPNVLDSQCTYL